MLTVDPLSLAEGMTCSRVIRFDSNSTNAFSCPLQSHNEVSTMMGTAPRKKSLENDQWRSCDHFSMIPAILMLIKFYNVGERQD